MSEATIFEYPYNLFLKQRLEFVVICQDHLEASIMRIVEYEMIKRKEAWQDKGTLAAEAKKAPPKAPKEYWARLSQGQIIARLYLYDSAKLEKPEDEDMESEAWAEYRRKKALSISKSTLRKAIDRLIEKGFLLMRSKPGDEFGAPIYTLHRANVQKALKGLPANPYTIFHAGGVSIFESGGESQNLEVPPPEFESGDTQNLEVGVSEDESGESQNCEVNIDNREIPSEIEQDNEESNAVPVETAAPASLSAFAERKKATGEHPAITQEMLAEKVIAPKITLPSKQPPSPQSQVSGPSDVAPPASVGGTAQSGAPATKKVTHANEPQQVPKCSTKEIQARINAHRGYALAEEVEIIRERKAIKTWCNLHELADYDTTMQHLKHDPYWGKSENYYRIGGLTLLKETPKALAEIAKPQNGRSPETLGNYHYYRPQAAGGGR